NLCFTLHRLLLWNPWKVGGEREMPVLPQKLPSDPSELINEDYSCAVGAVHRLSGRLMETVDESPEAVEAGQGYKFNEQNQIWNSNDGALPRISFLEADSFPGTFRQTI